MNAFASELLGLEYDLIVCHHPHTVGLSSCDCLPEEHLYLGSGKRIVLCVKKYKKRNFKKEILKKYLPEQLSQEELRKLVLESINKTGAVEIKDTGKIMQDLMPKVKGKADGSEISKIIKELLSK